MWGSWRHGDREQRAFFTVEMYLPTVLRPIYQYLVGTERFTTLDFLILRWNADYVALTCMRNAISSAVRFHLDHRIVKDILQCISSIISLTSSTVANTVLMIRFIEVILLELCLNGHPTSFQDTAPVNESPRSRSLICELV